MFPVWVFLGFPASSLPCLASPVKPPPRLKRNPSIVQRPIVRSTLCCKVCVFIPFTAVLFKDTVGFSAGSPKTNVSTPSTARIPQGKPASPPTPPRSLRSCTRTFVLFCFVFPWWFVFGSDKLPTSKDTLLSSNSPPLKFGTWRFAIQLCSGAPVTCFASVLHRVFFARDAWPTA